MYSPLPTMTKEPQRLARYKTVGDAVVSIHYHPKAGDLIAECSGERCPWREQRNTEGYIYDTPEQEAERVEAWLPYVQRRAQEHAEMCRAMPAEN